MDNSTEEVKEPITPPTKKQRVEYLKLSLAMQGIAVSMFMADMICTIFDHVQEKGIDFSIKDAIEIEAEIAPQYKDIPNEEQG